MQKLDLSPLLKVAARLLDAHDSRRASGESAQYQTEDRPGRGDGVYLAIAQEVLEVLQRFGAKSGDEYSSLHSIQAAVKGRLGFAIDLDIEYVLNVLSRPTELRLLHEEEGVHAHVIGEKDTALIEKAAHIVEFRLSRVGKTAIAMSSENMDIAYIEGDVTKLIRAIESGRLSAALLFSDRLLMQLRTEQLALIALIEQMSGGRKSRSDLISNMGLHRDTMRRTVDLVEEAGRAISALIKKGVPEAEEIAPGLIRTRVNELSAGVVRYGRELSRLAELTARGAPESSVRAPSFQSLAELWVVKEPDKTQISRVLTILGPTSADCVTPIGTDFKDLVRTKTKTKTEIQDILLDDFEIPPEDQFLEWLRINQASLKERLQTGELSLLDALHSGMGEMNGAPALNCLVAAITAPDEWISNRVSAKLDGTLTKTKLHGLESLTTNIALKQIPNDDEGTT